MSAAPLLETHALTVETPGGRALVRDLDLCLGRERVAVVGRNGVGKSTLLDVLAGRRQPARGRVVRRGRHLLVPQDPAAAADHSGEFRAGTSAGQRQRKRLEAARDTHPDLLLLDEPTRDLDARNLAWLLDWVSQWRGGLLVVSHDRRLLRSFNQFFVVAESGCRHVEGSFEDLMATLERDREDQERRYRRGINRLLADEQHHAAVRRRRQRKKNVGRIRELKRCPARIKLNDKRSYKQESQGKRRVLQEARIGVAREGAKAARRGLAVDLPLDLTLRPSLPTPPSPVIVCEGLAAKVGGRTLFRDLSLTVGRDRVAVCGSNGSGKTTFLEMALGLRPPAGGHVHCETSRLGYVAQNAANWCLQDTVVDQLVPPTEAPSPDRVAQLLDAHRFPLALAARPLTSLSPGERVRAALICLGERRPTPELLVLDEPTQDLDFVGLAALESVLAAWPGGLLVVSHDPDFLQAIRISSRLEL